MRRLGVPGQLVQEIRAARPVEITVDAGAAAAGEPDRPVVRTAIDLEIGMALRIRLGLVADRKVGHVSVHRRHVERLFRGLFVTVVDLGLAVVGETAVPGGGKQPHLLSGEQSRGIDHIPQGQRPRAPLHLGDDDHFHRYVGEAILQPIAELQPLATRLLGDLGAARNVVYGNNVIVRHDLSYRFVFSRGASPIDGWHQDRTEPRARHHRESSRRSGGRMLSGSQIPATDSDLILRNSAHASVLPLYQRKLTWCA